MPVPVLFWDRNGETLADDMPDEELVNALGAEQEEVQERERLKVTGIPLEMVLSDLPAQHLGVSRRVPQSVFHLGGNNHVVLLIRYDGAPDVIVRIPNPSESKHDPILKSVQRRKLGREAQMLRWMGSESFAKIPVPRVLQDAHDSTFPFLATSKCEGDLLVNHFGKLPLDAQVKNLESYRDIMLDMFRADCPQIIGSMEEYVPDAPIAKRITVGCCIGMEGMDSPSTFTSLKEYFAWLIASKERVMDLSSWSDDDRAHAERFWAELETRVNEDISHLEPALLRVVPVHEDFVGHNVVIDSSTGEITGVFDWEFHGLLPAVLAATYPAWIQYSGASDPRFTVDVEGFSSLWCTSRENAQLLRDKYISLVKQVPSEKDNDASEHALRAEFVRALERGAFLRDVYDWMRLYRQDPGCRKMQEWLNSDETSQRVANEAFRM